MNIGFLGLGKLGLPVSLAVEDKGHKIFGYDIYWDFHLEGLTYNVYGKNGEYGWHIDADSEKPVMDMKLTCLLNLLEEPYEGGDFIIDNQTQHFFREPGTAILFKSYLKHEVTPVTKGDRKTLTYFIHGPKFQ